MRPKERIHIFLKVLEKNWIEQGVDLRFTQFLLNNGLSNTNMLYEIEEFDLLRKMFPEEPVRNYLMLETYGKKGNKPLKYMTIKSLSKKHINAILKIQHQISNSLKTVLKDELKYRKRKKSKLPKPKNLGF